ncbi:DUF1376 domain-containing protein [Paraburkholderia caribensis]|uniref:DUF1376 domain-containing protein n=1 Tax=Paraburkholderia caribensis TaxID=75105 RepID=UPI001D09313B|nr:DUF1376 domain-containing protein [Paraburkholderia caribensis]
MNELPNPLTPADCDLRDFPYMPLDVQRLCDSDLAALESPEACWAALLLWCKAWHQVPTGSLPDDDRVLAKFTGYQRAPDAWLAIRDGALRGWIKCSDGRLYHPVVAEKANEGWFAKHRQAHDKLCERVRKRNKTREASGLLPLEVPELEQWIDMGRPLEKSLFPSEFSSPSAGKKNPSAGSKEVFHRNDDVFPPENALKGKEGKGEGKGEVNTYGSNDGGGTASRAREIDGKLTAAGISVSLIGWERERNKAARGITAANQQVIDLAALGVSSDELRRAYEAAVADRIATNDPTPVNAGFVRTFVEKNRRPVAKREDNAWKRSPAGIERKASELGVICPPGRDHGWLLEKCESVLRQRAQAVTA